MAVIKKTYEVSCPECGAEEISCYDSDCDYEGASYHYRCPHCGAEWSEYYKLVYSGYEYKDKIYDEMGNCTWDRKSWEKFLRGEDEDGNA